MNITGLLHNAVRNFRGPEPEDSNGAAGLSVYMGITAVSLSHKVSPTYPSAHCSPEEIVAICQLTRDHAPLQAMAKALGYVLLPVVPPDAEMDPQYVAQVTASAIAPTHSTVQWDGSGGAAYAHPRKIGKAEGRNAKRATRARLP